MPLAQNRSQPIRLLTITGAEDEHAEHQHAPSHATLRRCTGSYAAPAANASKISAGHQPGDRELPRDGREHLVQRSDRHSLGAYGAVGH